VIAAPALRGADFAGWRDAARRLLAAGIPPEEVHWGEAGLFSADPLPECDASTARVPAGFVALAEVAVRHRDEGRFALLYRVLWRLTHGEPALLAIATDADMVRLHGMTKAIRRDAHKMHAFVRFRCVTTKAGEHYVAWFEPEHHILEAEAAFFVRRFAQLHWSILTPDGSAHWDGEAVFFGPPGRKSDQPAEDAREDLWRAYYASIFNPARLKPDAMRAEMPVKYWKNLPEARDIARLIAEAPAREAAMIERGWTEAATRRQRDIHLASPGVEAGMDLFTQTGSPEDALAALRAEVLADRSWPMAQLATQAVFGEGPIGAGLMFIGEQPGDEEDLAGRPFIGPAGRMFNAMLERAGIERSGVYVTNAVKHFKFTPTGRRRIHQSPDAGDIAHYRPFLKREVEIVRPKLIVTLGATALRAMLGKAMAVTKVRGEVMATPEGLPIFPTVHPSYLLRLPDEDSRQRESARFLEDLKRASREVM
jgi:DNA polymerase